LHCHHAHPINLAELLLLLAHQPICQHITPTVAVSGMHDIPENYILHKGKAKDKLELNWNHLRRFGGLTTSTFSKQVQIAKHAQCYRTSKTSILWFFDRVLLS
jgi:hypothetical protein